MILRLLLLSVTNSWCWSNRQPMFWLLNTSIYTIKNFGLCWKVDFFCLNPVINSLFPLHSCSKNVLEHHLTFPPLNAKLPRRLLFLSKTRVILFKELLQDKQKIMKISKSLQNTLLKTNWERRIESGGKAGKTPNPLGNTSLYVIWTHMIFRHSSHLSYPIHLVRHNQCLPLCTYFQCFVKISRVDSIWWCIPIFQTNASGFQIKIERGNIH